MLRHKDTAKQLDKKYRNVDEEGRGTHRYYLMQKRANNRKLIEVIVFFILMILLAVFVFSIVDGNSYLDQWKTILHITMHHHPGHVNDGEVK